MNKDPKKQIKNISASVRARLLNIARQNNFKFDSLLLQYFQERFLYRLSISEYKDKFILKGGLLFLAYNIPLTRPTKDIDFLGKLLSSDFNNIHRIIQHIINIQVPDGIKFLAKTVMVDKIKKDQDYEGVKVKIEGELAGARKMLQIDIGFGDKVIPAPVKINFPVLLDHPVPQIIVYSKESVIAEKFEAIVKLELANSRMKDFYDILFLASSQIFKSKPLHKAIYTTFKYRNTPLEKRKAIFAEEFKTHTEKQKLWIAFLKRDRLTSFEKFVEVVDRIELFIEPIFIEGITKVSDKIWENKSWKWIEKHKFTKEQIRANGGK